MQSLPSIGIIGGAGPETGSLLFNQIISICQKDYHCHRDADFPLIHLLSYPFSEMLQGDPDHQKIQKEISQAFKSLKTDYTAIACNTLHIFLDGLTPPNNFVHLIKETKALLNERPLVLCSLTSRKNGIHQHFFPCDYPSLEKQKNVCKIIDEVLKSGPKKALTEELKEIINSSENKEAVLGCTELSLLNHHFPLILEEHVIIDPSFLLAKKLCSLVFYDFSGNY